VKLLYSHTVEESQAEIVVDLLYSMTAVTGEEAAHKLLPLFCKWTNQIVIQFLP